MSAVPYSEEIILNCPAARYVLQRYAVGVSYAGSEFARQYSEARSATLLCADHANNWFSLRPWGGTVGNYWTLTDMVDVFAVEGLICEMCAENLQLD